MFRYSSDRAPVTLVFALSIIDFLIYFLVDSIWWLAGYTLLVILPKGLICAWNHHHQHTLTFHAKPLNRLLEFFYALHTGVTTNLWVLHHVLGHHKNFLDQERDESAWKRKNGTTMGVLEYTFKVACTAYYRGFQVGKKHPRVQRNFLLYSILTFANLKGADLEEANLTGANLNKANMKGATIDDAILCKTKMPWGEENGDCQ